MQRAMRKHLEPGGISDKEALDRLYAELVHEGFNTAADRLERPN